MIGRRCKRREALSRAALIGRALLFPKARSPRSPWERRLESRCAALRARRQAGPSGRERPSLVGGHGRGGTPGPMPNPEVKPPSADGTAERVRGRAGRRRPARDVRGRRRALSRGARAFLYSCLKRPANSWVLNKLRQLGTLRGFVWVDVSANRVATVYTNAPKRPREAVLADLCTLLQPTVVRNVATVYTNAPKRRRGAISTDLCTLLPHRPGGEAHPTGAVRQPPTHTNSRSLQLGTCPHVSVYRLWGRWIRQTGCDRARRSCRLRRAVPRACLARRWFLAPSRG